MIRVPILSASLGGEISVPVVVDEEIAGVQFTLLYDSAALGYLSTSSQQNTLLVVNDETPGILRISIAGSVVVPNPVCGIFFTVNGPSELTIIDAVGSTTSAQDILLDSENGQINLLGDTIVNVKFSWSPPTPNQNVIEGIIYVSTDGVNFLSLASVPPSSVEHTEVMDPGQGNLFFHMRWRNPVDLSTPSAVVSLFTNAPDSPSGFNVEIVE